MSELIEEIKHAPPGTKLVGVVAIVVVAGLGLYVSHQKSSGGSASGAQVIPVDPSLTGGTSGVPFANLPAAPGTNATGGNTSITAAPVSSPAPVAGGHPAAPQPHQQTTYTVQSGDWLSKIAPRYGVSWQQLYAANRQTIGGNPNLIKPGQRLVIPGR
jgi:LysM repeat protein